MILVLPKVNKTTCYRQNLYQGKYNQGFHYPVFPITLNYLKHKPELIHIDWTHQWYLRESRTQTYIRGFLLILDLIIAVKVFRCNYNFKVHNLYSHNVRRLKFIQYHIQRQFILMASSVQFFSATQLRLCRLYYKKDFHKFSILAETGYRAYYQEVARSHYYDGKHINYLCLGNGRGSRNYENFLKENYHKLLEKSVVHSVENCLTLGIYRDYITDEEMFSLLENTQIVVLPYSKTVLNSGIYWLAKDFNCKVLVTKSLALRYDSHSSEKSDFKFEGKSMYVLG